LIKAGGTVTAIATVTDRLGHPLPESAIAFAGSTGQRIGRLSQLAPGVYETTITSTKAGAARITATVSTPHTPVSGTATLSTTAASPAHISLALKPGSILANGSASTLATATLHDRFGNPVSGNHVTITSTDHALHVGPVSPGKTPGAYRARITSTKAGAAVVTATDSSISPALSAAAALLSTRA
jgi:adhesin/invasin